MKEAEQVELRGTLSRRSRRLEAPIAQASFLNAGTREPPYTWSG